MRTKNLSPIKNQLIKLQLITSMTIFVVASTAYAVNDYITLKDLTLDNFKTISRVLSRNIAASLSFKDEEEANRILLTLDSEEAIKKAYVVIGKDKFAQYNRDGKGSNQLTENEKHTQKFSYSIVNNNIKIGYPIFDGKDYLGILVIKGEYNIVKTFALKYLLIILGLTISISILVLVLASYMQKSISSPLNSILVFLERIKVEKDYSLRIEHNFPIEHFQNLEFHNLVISFDEMIANIESKNKSIQAHSEELEELVEIRTKELYQEKTKNVHNDKLVALGQMAAGVAHEINNPLQVIQSNASIIEKYFIKDMVDKEKVLSKIERIQGTIKRINEIVAGLKQFSRDGTNDEMQEVTFKSILEETLIYTNRRFESEGVELKISDFDESIKVLCRPTQISQVILNLITNGIDEICNDKSPWMSIELEQVENYLKIKITDSGSGIPAEIRDKILDPFFTTKEVGKGTGLGLSISKGIITDHGGDLYINEKHKNTQFVITLPIA